MNKIHPLIALQLFYLSCFAQDPLARCKMLSVLYASKGKTHKKGNRGRFIFALAQDVYRNHKKNRGDKNVQLSRDIQNYAIEVIVDARASVFTNDELRRIHNKTDTEPL